MIFNLEFLNHKRYYSLLSSRHLTVLCWSPKVMEHWKRNSWNITDMSLKAHVGSGHGLFQSVIIELDSEHNYENITAMLTGHMTDRGTRYSPPQPNAKESVSHSTTVSCGTQFGNPGHRTISPQPDRRYWVHVFWQHNQLLFPYTDSCWEETWSNMRKERIT